MLITLGVAIITFGAGLFVGQHLSKSDFFKSKIEQYKIKAEQKCKESLIMKQIEDEARAEALTELKPELKEHIKKQELEKFTKSKEDKMKKFANMFSTPNQESGKSSTDKINNMLGINNDTQSSTDKINNMLGINKNNFSTDASKILGNNDSGDSNFDTDKIMGTSKVDEKQAERDRILSFLK